jgi:O-antigen/teichoic acid export membrane protein
VPSGPGTLAQLRTLAGQSAVYGLGTVVSRFAALILLPVYAHYLGRSDYGAIEILTAFVAAGATFAQFGMVNALFRFALEREGDARWAVIRAALAFCALSGGVLALIALALTPWLPDALIGPGRQDLYVVSCVGLWIALLYEPTVSLYRLEQRPARFTVITIVNVAVTVVASVIGVVVLHAGALGLVAGSYTGTAVALVTVAVDRRRQLAGRPDWSSIRPMLRFGLPFMPSRLALWGLNFANRILIRVFVSVAAAGVFAFGVRIGQVLVLLVTAFQLAWPPFAYAIADDGEARRIYRAVFTAWFGLGVWVALGLALLRVPILALFPARWAASANLMAIYAFGVVFYGGYYVVGVAVGRVKRTQFNWVVTGVAAAVNLALCVVLIPAYGPTGAAVAIAVAYAAMVALMTLRAEQVFPVGYEWLRVLLLLAVAGVLFAAGDRLLPEHGGVAWVTRTLVALAFPLALVVVGFFRPEERRRLRALGSRRPVRA